MRTRNIFRYLLAIIIALGTTVNTMAQQRNLKIYFSKYVEGGPAVPQMLVTDDNNTYDIPAGITISSEGLVWATSHRLFEGWHGSNTDRLIADYKDATNMESHMKLTFGNFPYEVNAIQMNAMNDLFSGSITELLNINELNTKCTSFSGNTNSSSDDSWALNVIDKEITFQTVDLPGFENRVLDGLSSFEVGEKIYRVKFRFGWPPFEKGNRVKIGDKDRTFIKAGWNGVRGEGSNITDNDDTNWAFRVQFTLPDIRMRCYNTTTGAVDNNIIKDQPGGTYMLKGYITAHAGAVVPTENPKNPEDFHFEYEADASKMVVRRMSGVIEQIKVTGDIPVTVKLMRDKRLVCSYTQTIHVYSVDPTRPEIAIGFENSKKGYDITVGDDNAQIKGIFTANGDNITLSNGTSGYHFEYSEDSNGEIIEIDPLTGVIIAKKEGDVVVSAVLKNGTTIKSNTSSYTLHVFAKDEGLDWHRVTTYYINNTSNAAWRIDNNTRHTDNYNNEWSNFSYEWKKTPNLRTNLNLQNTDDWKQITGFKTVASAGYWRVICQKVGLDIKVPKYSDVQFTYTLAGNVNCQGGVNYGLEVKDLGVATSSEADTKIKTIVWRANGDVTPSGAYRENPILPTIMQAGAGSNSANQVDANTDVSLEKSNANGAAPITDTHYLAIMSYLGKENSNKGDASFGYKGIPTYTYYATITYYNNDGTGNVWETQTFTSTSKTETKPMYSGKHNLTRNGYELLGWSTDPNATTAEYKFKGDLFCPYDAVNGGGKGPVSLYAVWSKIPDIVTLDSQGGEGGTTFVTATYGQPMPAITVPTRPGYEFYGYFTAKDYNDYHLNGGTRYYNSDGTSAKNWDKNSDVTLYAHWKSAKYIVTFDINGGIMQEHTQYNSEASMSKLEEKTDQLIKISFTYGHGGSNNITNAKPKKGGFKCIGFYDDDNVLVASVNTNPANYNITINKNNKYWKEGNWNWPHDVTFTARYEPKFTYENNVLDFGTETLEIGIDWSQGVIHDVVDAANYLMNEGSVSEDNPVMVVNLKNAKYLRGDLDAKYLKVPLENKPFFSPNLLVYLTNGFYDNNIIYDNLIFEGGGCKNLVVTDRYPIKVLYAFDANKASYARDAKVADDDKGKDQAKNSYWGTLCLPYPIRNNASGVKFYEFQSTANNYFMFEEMSDNEVIPANTPVLYCRTDGGVGSMITIEEEEKDVNCNGIITKDEMVSVPANPNFTALVKSYVNAHESIQDWEFRGNLKTNVFCGRGYINAPAEAIANSDITNNGEVYYFKQNKFTHLVPAMTKNGTHYDAGKMTLYPYRAYFYKKGVNDSSAKVSAYSILVVGEDGNTTDITDAIFGDGEGDGKIYDLNGIRVMQPVKGRLYIVNGQKKVYR